jgi:hypothetical protein
VFYLGVTHFKCQLKSKDLKCWSSQYRCLWVWKPIISPIC